MNMRFKTSRIPKVIEGKNFDAETFCRAGVFIWREAIPFNVISHLQQVWLAYYEDLISKGGRKIDPNNSVNYQDALPDDLKNFWSSDSVKNIAISIYGPDVALYNHRVVMKDRNSDATVFLHQDYCYHLGFPDKCSLFIPLFKCSELEGGLSFYPGTHQYGFLGDAGEIDKSKFLPWEKITPTLEPGDVAIMNSCLWHESGPNSSDTDRVLFDTIIQPSDDPSGRELIAGKWNTDFWIAPDRGDYQIDSLFINSRTKRLKEFYIKNK